MKKLVTVLSLLVTLSLCWALAAPLALAEEGAPVTADDPLNRNRAVIDWTPPGLTVSVAPGETEHARAVFKSKLAIPNARLVVSFPLSRYVTVQPSGTFPVVPGPLYPVDLTISLPAADADTAIPSVIAGIVQVQGDGQIYLQPLYVTIVRVNVRQPIQWTPSEVRLFLDWPTSTGVAPVATTTVTFTTAYTIPNARLRPTAGLDRVLRLSETGPLDLVPGVAYTCILTAHLPAGITSLADVDDLNLGEAEPNGGRWIISGQVQVYDANRTYQRTLPVTVILGPVVQPPVVTWRPPVVAFRLLPGQSGSQVVTLTTNITIENATLAVRGAISPYLTARFASTGPATLLPHTPYQVTLNVTPPAVTLSNRPLMGEVVVVDGGGRILRHDLKVTIFWLPVRPTPTPTVARP